MWEETIILLPDNVHYVFLSATIPNATQFAEWICHLHKQVCNDTNHIYIHLVTSCTCNVCISLFSLCEYEFAYTHTHRTHTRTAKHTHTHTHTRTHRAHTPRTQPCHVVYTEFRPTPLQHYMYPAGADGLYLVVDEKVRTLFIESPPFYVYEYS